MADAQKIRHAADIIKEHRSARPIVALSAMGDTTDWLLEAASCALRGEVGLQKIESLHLETAAALGIDKTQIEALLAELRQLLTGVSMIKELTRRTRDYLVSFGERMSARIMAAHLNSTGVPARALDSWDAGFVSDSNFTSADLLESVWQTIPQKFSEYAKGDDSAVPVVTGFIAKDANGAITTLGRGGSDLTATMIGAALHVDEIQTWKDVDGIMTADPRVCADARSVPEVTYEEAQELAMFGAQVLHPRSMLPCIRAGVPVRVKNSLNTKSAGTIIVEKHSGAVPPVIAITNVKRVTLIDIVSTRMLGAAGFLAHIFNQFLKWNISIDVIATSEVSVSLTVNTSADLAPLVADIGRAAQVRVHTGKAIVTIICDSSRASEILAKGFAALAREKINAQMISQGASKVNISVIVDEGEADDAVRFLHKAYF